MHITDLNKTWLIGVLMLLGGCACHGGLSDAASMRPIAGTLQPSWLDNSTLLVELDNKRFTGDQTSSVCHTDACRSVFRNVPRMYRRHVLNGQAELAAADGERLACEWTRYRQQVDGICRSPDGREFKLSAD